MKTSVGISDSEIKVYHGINLKLWNVWGNGNEGRITPDGIRYYYIKDHLGSIRTVLNENNDLVEAIDYDPWGHIARYWSSTSSKYKFTGKERDNETGYDYGVYPDTFLIGRARYYESRIGNWTSTDPLFEKHIQWSPYNYVLRNPIIFFDPDGKQIYSIGIDKNEDLLELQNFVGDDSWRLYFDDSDSRRIYIDLTEYNKGNNENLETLMVLDNSFNDKGIQYKFGYAVSFDLLTVDLNGRPYDPMPIEVLSTTPRDSKIESKKDILPEGYDGIVKIHVSLKFYLNKVEVSRNQIIGHELTEVAKRTIDKLDYPKAHEAANKKYYGGDINNHINMRLKDLKYIK